MVRRRSPWRGWWCGCWLYAVRRRALCRTAASRGQLADVVEEDGPLELVELRGVHRDLGEEGIGHEDSCLVVAARVGVAEQSGDVHLEGLRQPVERGERRHGLAVLDLRDVGAGDVHAGGELTLREIADVTQIANGGGDLQAVVGSCRGGDERQRRGSRFGLLDLEAFVAAAAQGVRCAELHQTAMITTQYLTLFDGCHHSCHIVCSGRTQSKDRGTCPITEQ